MIANSGRITKEKPSFKEKITNFFQYKFGSFTSTKYPITPETLGKTAPKCGVCLSLAIILGINAKKYSKRTQEEEVSEVNLSFNPHSLKLDEHLENRILPEGRNHISNQQENSNSDTMEHEIDGIYSPVMNLTQKIAGTRIQRSCAIFKKIKHNRRMLKPSDLDSFDKINRGQLKYGIGMAAPLGLFPISVYSTSLTMASKTRVWALGLVVLGINIAVFSHYGGKCQKFLEHCDRKYFYGQTLKQLQDDKFLKINQPKSSLSFHIHSQRYDQSLDKMKVWLKLNSGS